MELFVVGLSHKTAPIAVRERLAFSGEALELALSKLGRLPGVDEGVILSTCNRTEIYGVAGRPESAMHQVEDWLGEHSAADLGPHLYHHAGADALSHLFEVAGSLDSMVIGEPQILGQVKDAWARAVEVRVAGARSERFFNRAFNLAKRIRNETGVGEHAVSMSFVGVELARRVFGELNGRKVLLVGAGKMCELAATHLARAGVDEVVVANRSLENARELAQRYNGRPEPLSRVPELLLEADIVISSTSAPGHLITRETLAPVVKARRYRPLLLIDLAVPRDIEPTVNSLANVYAYDVDDLQHVVEENVQQRQDAAERGRRLVSVEVDQFVQDETARQVLPVVAALRHHAASLAVAEAEHTFEKLSGLPLTEVQRRSVEREAMAAVNKLLHVPTEVLRQTAGSDEGQRLAAAVVRLFGLDVEATERLIAEEKAARRAAREAALAADEAGEGETEEEQSPGADVLPLRRNRGGDS